MRLPHSLLYHSAHTIAYKFFGYCTFASRCRCSSHSHLSKVFGKVILSSDWRSIDRRQKESVIWKFSTSKYLGMVTATMYYCIVLILIDKLCKILLHFLIRFSSCTYCYKQNCQRYYEKITSYKLSY